VTYNVTSQPDWLIPVAWGRVVSIVKVTHTTLFHQTGNTETEREKKYLAK